LTVQAVARAGTDAAAISNDVPARLRATFAFEPGQAVTVLRRTGGRVHRRVYSICSAPGQALQIGVRERPGGQVSPWLVRQVRAGDILEVAAPSGTFDAGASSARRLLLVAAGAGITPVLSILRTALEDPGRRVCLLHINRSPSSAMFGETLAELQQRHDAQLDLVRLYTRAPHGLGRPTRAEVRRQLLRHNGWLPDACVRVCGPPGLADTVRDVVLRLGVTAQAVRAGSFAAAAPDEPSLAHAGSAAISRVTVVADGRESVVAAPRSGWILDAVRQAGVEVPYSCCGGVCGACRALIRAGAVDQRANSFLSAADVRRGYVLTCRARPADDRIVVDFDA
jgi:ring-1,2-phenylacetyl-CoA epoxidase subunit PaaE